MLQEKKKYFMYNFFNLFLALVNINSIRMCVFCINKSHPPTNTSVLVWSTLRNMFSKNVPNAFWGKSVLKPVLT